MDIRHFHHKKHSGFTLLELMVVIAIIGVMAAISIPFFLNPEHKAKKAARELMGDMQRTRVSAIKANQDWAIVFKPATNTYYICSGPGADNVWSTPAVPENDTIEKTVSFTGYGAGVQYGGGVATTNATIGGGAFPANGVSYGADVLTFNARGTCSSGYAYIFHGDASYAVGTLSTGIVRIQRWTGGAWR